MSYFRTNNTLGSLPVWACDLRPGQGVARLEVEVPGVTNKYVHVDVHTYVDVHAGPNFVSCCCCCVHGGIQHCVPPFFS